MKSQHYFSGRNINCHEYFTLYQMEEDWDNDNDVQVNSGFSFDKREFAVPDVRSDYPRKHYSRDRESGSRDRNQRRSSSNRSRESDRPNKTFEIQGNQIGAFIGKGGSNIRNYEEKFGVKLNLDKSSNTVTVSGDPKNISEACDFIQQDLNNLQSRPPRRDDAFGSSRRDDGFGSDRPRNGG